MKVFLWILTLVVLFTPSLVNASEKKESRVVRNPDSIQLKELLVPSPYDPKRLSSELAVPPPEYGKEEPQRMRIHDVDFLRRANTRYQYGN